MDCNYFRKELPDFHTETDLSNVTHFFDGKDIIIETIQDNGNLRCRTRSKKVSDSACRALNFSTHTGLTFEHTRIVGGRASENQMLEWWGSSFPHEFLMESHENYFTHETVPAPK